MSFQLHSLIMFPNGSGRMLIRIYRHTWGDGVSCTTWRHLLGVHIARILPMTGTFSHPDAVHHVRIYGCIEHVDWWSVVLMHRQTGTRKLVMVLIENAGYLHVLVQMVRYLKSAVFWWNIRWKGLWNDIDAKCMSRWCIVHWLRKSFRCNAEVHVNYTWLTGVDNSARFMNTKVVEQESRRTSGAKWLEFSSLKHLCAREMIVLINAAYINVHYCVEKVNSHKSEEKFKLMTHLFNSEYKLE